MTFFDFWEKKCSSGCSHLPLPSTICAVWDAWLLHVFFFFLENCTGARIRTAKQCPWATLDSGATSLGLCYSYHEFLQSFHCSETHTSTLHARNAGSKPPPQTHNISEYAFCQDTQSCVLSNLETLPQQDPCHFWTIFFFFFLKLPSPLEAAPFQTCTLGTLRDLPSICHIFLQISLRTDLLKCLWR